MSVMITSVSVLKDSVEVQFQDGRTITFLDSWLRDHCRCPSCYHADTFQRAQHILDIPESKVVDIAFTKTQLTVTWDDKHESRYEVEFLFQFEYASWKERKRQKPVLWHGGSVAEKVVQIPVEKFLKSEEGATKVFQSLLDYGVALIVGVAPTLEATEQVCKALGGVQHTNIFGGMWEFSTEAVHADTAYTNLPLAAHNDSTYFTETTGSRQLSLAVKGSVEGVTYFRLLRIKVSARLICRDLYLRLQILHCIEHSGGVGGETVLVDGFYGARRLQADFPEDFDFLTTFDLDAEYIEEGHHHKHSAPVIQIDRNTMDLRQIRFNVYDRAPMAFAEGEECRKYYRSLKNLAKYYQDPGNQWQFKLKPGIVIVMDNFRILHGRTGFSGKRVLCGSYVARSDWLDRARVLHLIQ